MLLFSKRLKEVRKRSGLTQQQLGNMIGVTKVSVCCYEKGTRTPTLDTLIDLSNALNVDFTYLLGNDEYVIADDDQRYGINLAKEEIQLIKVLRKHIELYGQLLEDPERTIKLIEKKMR